MMPPWTGEKFCVNKLFRARIGVFACNCHKFEMECDTLNHLNIREKNNEVPSPLQDHLIETL